MKKEAALIVMAVVWLLTRALAYFEITADGQLLEDVAELVVMLLGALLIRFRVFSEATVRAAGFTPDELKERAEDPSIVAARD